MVVLNALSPSRANDFLQCPLKYRFRAVDKLPEPPSKAALKGTLVHAALDALFDLPAADRQPERAGSLIAPAWETLLAAEPAHAELFSGEEELRAWLAEAERLFTIYFDLELPQRLEPSGREEFVQHTLQDGLVLRGFVDRIDIAPGGQMRVVDYKTGRQPRPQYSREAQFQMRFYAVLMLLTRGVVPHTLQLMYLGSGTVVRSRPTQEETDLALAQITDVWAEIRRAAETGRWRPVKSRLCDWCHFRPLCPAWGGTPPPAPEVELP